MSNRSSFASRRAASALLFTGAVLAAAAANSETVIRGNLSDIQPGVGLVRIGGTTVAVGRDLAADLSIRYLEAEHVCASGRQDRSGYFFAVSVGTCDRANSPFEPPVVTANPAASSSSTVSGIVGTGIQGIVGTGVQGIVGTGVQGIVGTGVQGIVGTGVQGIVGTGVQGIVGTGVQGIVGTGVQGIVGTGVQGIVGTGVQGIVGTGR